MAFQKVEMVDIPRRKTEFGEGGPLVIPPGAEHKPGRKKCETCKRMVAPVKGSPRKGSCKCLYYRRTTNFIDVLQDEYLLKQWGKRNVAWGMAQRPDLQLAAAACKPDSYYATGDPAALEDKRELNRIAKEAGTYAGDMYKATIGSSLHRLTHQMDRGDELGTVPDRWVDDLKIYAHTIKSKGIEWVSVESFRVGDWWVKDIADCNHKAPRYGGTCECFGVAGTVDRIGWYKGRLRIFDIKTGSDFNKLGHAMQLAAYAHMTPYQFPGDIRTKDVDQVDLSVGHIIYLPEGAGECRIEPMDLEMGWRACELAKLVWEAREWEPVIERDVQGELTEMAARAGTIKECRLLWKNAADMGRLDGPAKHLIKARVEELKARGVTK
jgi:PD-(D/E)XK nuclease superfamily